MEHLARELGIMVPCAGDSAAYAKIQRNPSYSPDPGTKHDAQDNGVCSVHNISRSNSQPQPAYYLVESGEL